MKTTIALIGTISCAALTLVSGCKKEEAPPAVDTTTTTRPTATTPSDAAKVVDTTKATAEAVTSQVAAQATTQVTAQATAQVAVADSQSQAQSLIDRAKALVADKKYQDALTSLSQLSGMKLTADQQSLVDSLKAQIQKALTGVSTTDPASALGGALGGKK